MVMSPLMPTLYYPKQRSQHLADDAFPSTGRREHKLCHFLARAPALPPCSCCSGRDSAAELPQLSQCEKAFSRSERKEQPRTEGHEGMKAGTDFAYCVKADGYKTAITDR